MAVRKPTPPAETDVDAEDGPPLLYASEDVAITEELLRNLLERDTPLPPGERYATTRMLLVLACVPLYP